MLQSIKTYTFPGEYAYWFGNENTAIRRKRTRRNATGRESDLARVRCCKTTTSAVFRPFFGVCFPSWTSSVFGPHVTPVGLATCAALSRLSKTGRLPLPNATRCEEPLPVARLRLTAHRAGRCASPACQAPGNFSSPPSVIMSTWASSNQRSRQQAAARLVTERRAIDAWNQALPRIPGPTISSLQKTSPSASGSPLNT